MLTASIAQVHSARRGTVAPAVAASQDETELEEDLLRIIAGQVAPEFHFQPIVDVSRGVVAGYEALARLPVRARLPPDVCLQAAARMGVQIELEGVLARGALDARAALPANSFLCVNVSPGFLTSSAWEGVLNGQNDLARVVVEITEEQCIVDYDCIRSRIAGIRAKGGTIAIDDAGAGYASLKHILELRPSFIKLDRSFISHCNLDRAKSVVIEMMGAAASRMDAWIIAEGVETAAELAELVRLGVPLAQGYFLGRPGPAMETLLPGAREELKNVAVLRASRQDLLLLSEPCPAVHTLADAQVLLDRQLDGGLVAITDECGCPLALLEHDPNLGRRTISSFMRCQAASDAGQALQRALTRPSGSRFDPLVLIDAEGRLQGIARLDRLMMAALQQGYTVPASPTPSG